jgi:hypothetical protein
MSLSDDTALPFLFKNVILDAVWFGISALFCSSISFSVLLLNPFVDTYTMRDSQEMLFPWKTGPYVYTGVEDMTFDG